MPKAVVRPDRHRVHLVFAVQGLAWQGAAAALLSHLTRPAGMGGLLPAGTSPTRGHRCVYCQSQPWQLSHQVVASTHKNPTLEKFNP